MKKFKKISALAVAAVTLVSTAITASAGIAKWNEKSIEMGAIKNSYYLANNTIHHSDLLSGVDKNFLTFSSVDKRLKEGNIVLSVDFSDPNSDCEWEISEEVFDKIPDYMDGLYLKDAKDKYITEGKYPLIVSYNAPDAYINVMVGHPTIFFDFDLTQGYYTACGSKNNYFYLHYQIRDFMVLPSYNIVLEEISGSSNPAKFTGEIVYNNFTTYSKSGRTSNLTTGYMDFVIPTKYAGKSFNAYINGMKVGKVTLPKAFGEKAALVNY